MRYDPNPRPETPAMRAALDALKKPQGKPQETPWSSPRTFGGKRREPIEGQLSITQEPPS